MNVLNLWLTFSIFFTLILWKMALPKSSETAVTVGRFTAPVIFLFAFILRVILAMSYPGFGADIACFSSWSERMIAVGPSGFYAKDFFSDYPPMYLYILYLLGLIRKWLSVSSLSPVHLLILKSPALLADLGIGYLIYRFCARQIGLRSSLCLTAIFLFQPVVLLNSVIWGQIDSVFTLLLVAVCLFLEQRNLLPAMLFFGAGILLKPQMLIFTPLLILGMLQYIFRGSFSLHMLMKALSFTLLALILMLLVSAPFGMENVIPQYADTLSSYPYASVNAYNFWAGAGLNWHPQSSIFCGMTASAWGSIAIVLAGGLSLLLGLRLGNLHQKYSLMGSFLIITVFTFSVRMHERYLYPMIVLLLFSFSGYCTRQLSRVPVSAREEDFTCRLSPALRIFFPLLYTAFTCLNFYNTGHVLLYYDPLNYNSDASAIRISGIALTLCTVCFYILLLRLQSSRELSVKTVTEKELRTPLRIHAKDLRCTRTDLILILLITLFYSFFAFRDLGESQAPETMYTMQEGESITLRFAEDHTPASLSYYIAPDLNISFRMDGFSDDLLQSDTLFMDTVFTWKTLPLPGDHTSLTLTLQSGTAHLLELVLTDENGVPIEPKNASDYPQLFDEASLYPEYFSFRNSMYFDEIYHARTAYEYLKGWYSYENTHPPLGKVLISAGIALFGMNPFGWRISGTLFGILMLPALYLFARRITGDSTCSALSTWIFAFDFMHFSQTRIATIDVYIVFFVICMYYFLYYFITLDYGTCKAKELCLPLGLCGLSMGLGFATKWTGVYAGFGMAVLFFGHLFLLYRKQQQYHQSTSSFLKKTGKIILFCLIFFVAVPAGIYLLSYLPFHDGSAHGLLKRALDNQKTMYSYHSQLEATHYFASPFYEWPLIIRPIWFYSGIPSETLREGISSFGNPLVWWTGLPALIHMICLMIRKKDRRAVFLVIGYLAQYLPWFFVERLTFIYHYFPSVVFLALMIGYSVRNLKETLPPRSFYTLIFVYGLSVFALFILFLPVLSGKPVELEYVKNYLRWFKTWVLVAG